MYEEKGNMKDPLNDSYSHLLYDNMLPLKGNWEFTVSTGEVKHTIWKVFKWQPGNRNDGQKTPSCSLMR